MSLMNLLINAILFISYPFQQVHFKEEGECLWQLFQE